MLDVNVTMDNVKNVGVEFERESGNLWLYFEEGQSQLLTIVTPEVWQALTTAVDKACSPE